MSSISRSSFIGRRSTLALLFATLGLLALLQKPAKAQAGAGSGRIEGTVTDSSGSVVPGALVTAHEETTGIAASVATEDDGHFSFPYLTPGSYDISIKKDGFASAEIKHLTVRVGTTSSVRPQLKVGDVATCLYRDCDVVVTSWTDAPLPWPRCRALRAST